SLVSLMTAILAFKSMEFSRQTLITFFAYYTILGFMILMFRFQTKLTDPRTRQFLQFSFFLLGFVLMVTALLGMLSGELKMASIFLLMLFLPGLATLRAGLYFNKNGE
ncbi:MAG: hypothetical protein K9N29_09415, partial [Candidatus Marinimicrobia bacterium]|nr:hypothetical protein [Candidatus Neomarinimicrobiota bacterium]